MILVERLTSHWREPELGRNHNGGGGVYAFFLQPRRESSCCVTKEILCAALHDGALLPIDDLIMF